MIMKPTNKQTDTKPIPVIPTVTKGPNFQLDKFFEYQEYKKHALYVLQMNELKSAAEQVGELMNLLQPNSPEPIRIIEYTKLQPVLNDIIDAPIVIIYNDFPEVYKLNDGLSGYHISNMDLKFFVNSRRSKGFITYLVTETQDAPENVFEMPIFFQYYSSAVGKYVGEEGFELLFIEPAFREYFNLPFILPPIITKKQNESV